FGGREAVKADLKPRQLHMLIGEMRDRVTTDRGDPLKPLQELYGALIAPAEKALSGADPEVLLLQLDERLRYVPFAALHDGRQYLIERWPLLHLMGASTLGRRQSAISRITGFGTTRAHHGLP